MSSQHLIKALHDYKSQLRTDFEEAVTSWSVELKQLQTQEVLGGLLSRQCTLCSELVTNSRLWNNIVSPVIVRAMTEVAIDMAWINQDPTKRSAEFIKYGLGQSKLALEHVRNLESLLQEDTSQIEAQALWLNCQQHEIFTDVNVGSWSGLSLEQMSIEGQVQDSFKLYSFLVGAAHGTWDHVHQMYRSEIEEGDVAVIASPKYSTQCLELAAHQLNLAFIQYRYAAKQKHTDDTYRDFIAKLKTVLLEGPND
ncbi:MAG: hypothetical protein QG574_4754 [Cyanobacteriota bacterium erpe_2018_sw_21hr_WHONDRS-SW48-000092_B_bin.40]|jgi:hypothetical protein|nr:hypothetical protein [Cyanobacteriota bacterium erpe_2018_sw_21hr_WHONDRS-SW48-000092_B_bin.40]